MKDDQDRALEALLRSRPIDDGGFTARVMGRIRRRELVRRLALPVAVALGLLLALPPALRLLDMGRSALANVASSQLGDQAAQTLTSLVPSAALGVLVMLAFAAVPLLED